MLEVSGKLLTAARILAGLSQADLAEQAGCAVSALARFEQGRTSPRLATVRALVSVLARYGVELLPATDRYEVGIAVVRGSARPEPADQR